MKNLISYFTNREFLMFIFVGIINTFGGVIYSMIYTSILSDFLSFIAGYITSLIISYLLNTFITFKQELSFRVFVKFVISYIPNFIIQNVVVWVCLQCRIPNYISYLFAAIIGIPITFIFMKSFAFKNKKD